MSIYCPGCKALYVELQEANRNLKMIAGALLQCGSLFETGRGSNRTLNACTKPRGHKGGNHGLAQVKR